VSRCDGGKNERGSDHCRIGEEYDESADTLRGDVLECLGELRQRKLVVFKR